MRLGGPVFGIFIDPEVWAQAVVAASYRAAFCPLKPDADNATIAAYAEAAQRHDILIAEVGAWSNPLSPDAATRKAAVEHCKASLSLADRIGARCCVNIAGSRGPKWDGPYPDDLTEETFEMIVETVRDIIDSVGPSRTYYTLETMPWMYPDSADRYLALIRAIDRRQCAMHLDPVNLINSPHRYFNNAALISECFAKLGPMIKSCHAKDIILGPDLTVHLSETRPGLGGLDYAVFLREVACLHPDTPVMLEHLSKEEDYRVAAEHVRSVAARESIPL